MRTPRAERPPWRRSALLSARVLAAGVCACAVCVGGCAQVDRAVFDLNIDLARNVFQPMSRTYQEVVPKPVRTGLRNLTDNIRYTDVLANNLLQGKLDRAHTDLQRIVVNTLCFGGLFDAATDIGIPRYDEDFGQTLGVWGFEPGPYFNIPFLGPSTARDAMLHPFRFFTSPFTYVDATAVSLPLSVAGYLFERFDQVESLEFVEEAVDPYAFVEKAYLEQRLDKVHDGNPPGKQAAEEEAIDDALEGLEDDLGDGGYDDALEDLDDLEDLDETDAPENGGATRENDELEGLEDLDDLEVPAAPTRKRGAAPVPAPQIVGRGALSPRAVPAAGGLPPPRIVRHRR